jgi:hypothetical protein
LSYRRCSSIYELEILAQYALHQAFEPVNVAIETNRPPESVTAANRVKGPTTLLNRQNRELNDLRRRIKEEGGVTWGRAAGQPH